MKTEKNEETHNRTPMLMLRPEKKSEKKKEWNIEMKDY